MDWKDLDNDIVLTNQAIQDLVVKRESPEKVICYSSKRFFLAPSKNMIQLQNIDLNIYIKILQKVASSKFIISSAPKLADELGYKVISKNGNKEASGVSKSLSRLESIGYIVRIRSWRDSKIIPLVRRNRKSKKDSTSWKYSFSGIIPQASSDSKKEIADGFYEFLDQEEREELFIKARNEFSVKREGKSEIVVKSLTKYMPELVIDGKRYGSCPI